LTEERLGLGFFEFDFQNSIVKMVCTSPCPEIQVAGGTLGPLNRGMEFETLYWVAEELAEAGIARFRDEDLLNLKELHKYCWRESIQSARRVSSLPTDFYPRLRRLLFSLKGSGGDSAADYDKALRMAQDIVNCRLRKIVSLASAPPLTDEVLGNMTGEERLLYNVLRGAVQQWRSNIFKTEVELK